jgi:crotonobetainyl-CoA:carnitine CoA-transferase CaiB-like acyl-CoA transferase
LHVDGNQYGLSPLYRLYECADDGWLFVAAVRAEHRTGLARALGEDPAAFDDPEKVTAILEGRLRECPAAEWWAALDAEGVPVEVANEEYCRTLFDDPEARAEQLVSVTSAGGVGRFEDPGLLVNLSATPGVIQRGPCMCGEHTREIMLDHGYSSAEVDALHADRVVLDAR